jgi:TRAP-type transport system periplasmic protein
MPFYATTFAWVINKAVGTTKMSAAQKKVIDDHCTNEWAHARSRRRRGRTNEATGVQKLSADPGP